MTAGLKKIPESVLVFGAGGRVGSQVAKFLRKLEPNIRLRLVTTDASKVAKLENMWPSSEVVVADFFDESSLSAAVKDMEGVFVVTPGSFNERTAMTNLVKALKENGDKLIHVIRLVGMFPAFNTRRVPQTLGNGLGLPVQSPIAKEILEESLLPVTFLNSGATFFDNFLWMKRGLNEDHKLIWPSRLVPYIDVPDIGEIAARLFLSSDHKHIGQFHTMNNGADLLRIPDVAEVMSQVWQVKITADTSKEGFCQEYSHLRKERQEYLWDFFKFEEENEVAWSLNDFAERTMGRKPKTLVQWLVENQSAILG